MSFRGSRSIGNWLANFNIVQQAYAPCSGCTVHSGFYDTWKQVQALVMPALTSARQQWPNYRIVATGHSLGGAVASIAVGELRQQGYTVDLVRTFYLLSTYPDFHQYSYGAPMSGNYFFVQYISGQGNNFRVVSVESGSVCLSLADSVPVQDAQ
jgi:hypothetical protein